MTKCERIDNFTFKHHEKPVYPQTCLLELNSDQDTSCMDLMAGPSSNPSNPSNSCEMVYTYTTDDYLKPIPITQKIASEPFPINTLPNLLQKAIEEGAREVQAPQSLIASVILSYASISSQHAFEICRDPSRPELTGRISEFFIVAAKSGERKTAADNLLGKAVIEWISEKKKEL